MIGTVSSPDSLISKRDKFGILCILNTQLVLLLLHLESIITKDVNEISDLNADTFWHI